MAYVDKVRSLQDRASARVAINFCQNDGFKEVVLRLEGPTYDAFAHAGPSQSSIDDTTWEGRKMKRMKKASQLCYALRKSCDPRNGGKQAERWNAAVDEQCRRLLQGDLVPASLKRGVHVWMSRVALEYLSYCRRQRVLFGMKYDFWMNILTPGDWTGDCRLAEEKIAERLLMDERLEVLLRYRIACIYSLYESMGRLWAGLTQKDKQFIFGDNPRRSQERNSLVLLWSYYIDGRRDQEITGRPNGLWGFVMHQAICRGNRAVLLPYWKKYIEREEKKDESIRKKDVIGMALLSVQNWQRIRNRWSANNMCRQHLITSSYPGSAFETIESFNLPSYYSKLVCCFLGNMGEKKQWKFFEMAFLKENCDSVLECFLDWPHQVEFLPMMEGLRERVPAKKYGQFLLALASKYSEGHSGENRYYDYRSLFWGLWNEIPESYKQRLFRDSSDGEEQVASEALLLRLLERSPFAAADEEFFKEVWRYFPKEKREAMMYSKTGQDICSVLTRTEKWSLANWLLEECLPKTEIPRFKEKFARSDCGRMLCLYTLEENRAKSLEDLINWSYQLDRDKSDFKYDLIWGEDCLESCKILLNDGQFTEVERMIDFSLSQKKGYVKKRFAENTCNDLLKECAWGQMDRILNWSFDTGKEIRNFKKRLFSRKGNSVHKDLVITERRPEDVEHFYKWFCLSPEEIKEIKRRTLKSGFIKYIKDEIGVDKDGLVESLLWCVTDMETLMSVKREIEESLSRRALRARTREAMKLRLGNLVYELQTRLAGQLDEEITYEVIL